MPSAPLPRSVQVGYGLGSFCSGTFSTVPGLLLLYYLTNVLAVPAWAAGLVVFLPKAWDLVVNPLVGKWSDRTLSRHGPRRPWLLAGAIVMPPAFAATFAGPPLHGLPAAGYVGFWFVAAATAYALFEVPYKAMPAEMTDDYHAQSRLLTWRMAFLGAAVLISGALAPAIVNGRGGAPTVGGYRVMGCAIGLVLGLGMLGAFAGTARAPVISRAAAGAGPAAGWRDQFRAARGDRTFVTLLTLCCAQMLAIGIMLAGAPYFATYVLGDPKATTTLFVALVGPLVCTMPLWIRVSRRLDKRGAMVLASVLFTAGAAGMALTSVFGAGYAHGCVVVVGVGYAGLQMLQYSMLADTLIAHSLRSDRHRGGLLTGVWTAAETIAAAFGALVLSMMLQAAGFVSAEPGHRVAQPASAVDAVLAGATLLPAVLVGAAIVLALRYDLTAETLAELHARSRAKAAHAG